MDWARVPLAISSFHLVVTAGLFFVAPKGFIPSDDLGFIVASTEGIQGISFEDMRDRQKVLADMIRAEPEVASVQSTVGAGGRNSTANAGSIFITLKPRSERKVRVDALIDRLRPKLAKVEGIRVYMQNP